MAFLHQYYFWQIVYEDFDLVAKYRCKKIDALLTHAGQSKPNFDAIWMTCWLLSKMAFTLPYHVSVLLVPSFYRDDISVLKTGDGQPSGGSNPSPSALLARTYVDCPLSSSECQNST